MTENPMQGFMDSTLKNLKSMVDVNTIVGEAVTTPDGTIIIPVSTVGFGFGAGGSEFGKGTNKGTNSEDGMFGGGCGGGVSIKPTAFLVVNNSGVRLLPVSQSTSAADKIIDLVPEMIERVNNAFSDMSQKRSEKKKEKEFEKNNTVNVVDLDDFDD